MEILLQLFFSFATVGLFCVGGGYASMPLIQAEVIAKYKWMTMNEFPGSYRHKRGNLCRQ